MKPSYHALKLLDQQDKYLVLVSEDCLVTKAENPGFLQILLHNCKRPGWRYYSNETMEKAESYTSELFEDADPVSFHIIIEGLIEGEYLLKCRSVSDEAGSAFTDYLRMEYPDDSFIGNGERNYLRASSVIPMTGKKYSVGADGQLELNCTLNMNEFVHLHIIRILN